MKKIADITEDIYNYWDNIEIEQRHIDKIIKEYASVTDYDIVVKEIRENFTQDKDSGMDVIYFALCENPEKWYTFFAEEYENAFRIAETIENPFEYLEILEAIVWRQNKAHQQVYRIIDILIKYLNHEIDAIRFEAIWLIENWLVDGNENKYPNVIRELKDKLKDKNWRVRWCAFETLSNLNQLPINYKINILDKFRIKFFDKYKF